MTADQLAELCAHLDFVAGVLLSVIFACAWKG